MFFFFDKFFINYVKINSLHERKCMKHFLYLVNILYIIHLLAKLHKNKQSNFLPKPRYVSFN